METSDTEMKARIRGIASQMETFRYLFGLLLSSMILRHTDMLSRTLQNPELTSVEGHEVAMLTVKTLQRMHSFEMFWKRVELRRRELDVEVAVLPRKRKVPKRCEVGAAEPHFHNTPESFYQQIYFEALDLSIASITNHFDQPGFKFYSGMEQLLFKACKGEDCEAELTAVCDVYGEELSRQSLEPQLKVLRTLYLEKVENDEQPSFRVVKQLLQGLSQSQRSLLNMVYRVFELLLIMPATNSTSERSFSALRRIKTYLRSTMSQSCMNHLMLLHYHQSLTDSLDMKQVGNDFITANESRMTVFAQFT